MSEMKMGRRNIGAMQKIDNIPNEEAKKALDFSLGISQINTGRVQSPDELAERFEKLFELAVDFGRLPRYEHLVMVSGLPKSTFYDYGNENYEHTPNPRYSDVIKRAKYVISAAEADLASSGKIPAPVYIFRAKNYEGLRDVQEIKATSDFNTDPQTPEEIVNALPDVENEEFVEIDKS